MCIYFTAPSFHATTPETIASLPLKEYEESRVKSMREKNIISHISLNKVARLLIAPVLL